MRVEVEKRAWTSRAQDVIQRLQRRGVENQMSSRANEGICDKLLRRLPKIIFFTKKDELAT